METYCNVLGDKLSIARTPGDAPNEMFMLSLSSIPRGPAGRYQADPAASASDGAERG